MNTEPPPRKPRVRKVPKDYYTKKIKKKPRSKNSEKTKKAGTKKAGTKKGKIGRPKKDVADLASVRISLRLTTAQADMLKELAEKEGRTVAGQAAWLIKKHLESEK